MCFRSELVWVNVACIITAMAYLDPPGVPAGKVVTGKFRMPLVEGLLFSVTLHRFFSHFIKSNIIGKYVSEVDFFGRVENEKSIQNWTKAINVDTISMLTTFLLL